LVYLDDPAFGTFDFAALDAGEGLAKLGHDGTGLLHAGKLDGLVIVGDLAHGTDDRRRTAKAGLDEVAVHDLADLDRSLVDLHAQHVGGDGHERAARDGGEDGVRVAHGHHERALFVDEDDVGTACLLDIGA